MSGSLWWAFITTSFVLDLTPGPAVLLVLSSAIRYGAARTVVTICGILCANAIYFAISATSIGALLLSSYRLFFLIKWVGAAYLIYLGVKALLSRGSHLELNPGADAAPRTARLLFLDGLLLQLSNPKAFLYFAAILPQFIDPQAPVGPQVFLLGATNTVIEFAVQLGYAMAAGRALAAARESRYAGWLNRVSGLFLIGSGGGLALMRRD